MDPLAREVSKGRAIARCTSCDAEYVTRARDVEVAERNGWGHHCRACTFEAAAKCHDRSATVARAKRNEAAEARDSNVERFRNALARKQRGKGSAVPG